MWKNLEQIRRQVEEGAKEFAQTAIDGVRDLKAQQSDDEGEEDSTLADDRRVNPTVGRIAPFARRMAL